jgi:hypothetical protein
VKIFLGKVFFSNGSERIYSCSMAQFLKVVTDIKPERKRNDRRKEGAESQEVSVSS